MTQWLGGMGVIVLGVAILPLLGTGGMQLARAESPGPTPDRLASAVPAVLLVGAGAGLRAGGGVAGILDAYSPSASIDTDWEAHNLSREALARRARGGMRDALSLADQLLALVGDAPQLADVGRLASSSDREALQQARHLPAVQRSLDVVQAYAASPIAGILRLVSCTVDDSGVSNWQVAPDAFVLRVGEGDVTSQLKRLPPVLRYLRQHGLAARPVDVSYRKRVVIMPEG